MDDFEVEVLQNYFARTALPPRGHHYFADLRRRITATIDSAPQPAVVLAMPEPKDHLRWEQIAQHREGLLRVARRRCPTREDAEDIVSEAMLRCMTFDGLDPARAEQFLRAVTVRLCADQYRNAERHGRALAELAIPETTAGPEDELLGGVEAIVLKDLLARLPPRQRSVITMYANGLTVSDIASRQRLTFKATESALARARYSLRTALARVNGQFVVPAGGQVEVPIPRG